MTASRHADTEELLDRAQRGDDAARQELLMHHRNRLKRMIAIRLDRRMAARVDPSDVVQETLKNGRCPSIRGCGNWPGKG